MRIITLLFCSLFVGQTGLTQDSRPEPQNEILLLGQHSGFTDPARSPHRTATLQYYRRVSRQLRLFGDVSLNRRFDLTDGSGGLGAYYIPDRRNSFYCFVTVGVKPEVIPRVDAAVEYTRLLLPGIAGSVGYRFLDFGGEKVHMAFPGVTLYRIPRVELTAKVYAARTVSDARLRFAFFLRAAVDLSDRVVPELYYSVGSEAYRATTLDLVASQHAWNLALGAKVLLTEGLAVRGHLSHGARPGYFEETGADLSFSIRW